MNFITDAQLRGWLAQLIAESTVIAPRRAGEDLLLYQPVEDPDAICYDFGRSTVSPREFFLPATEALLTVERVRQATAGDGATAGNATVAGQWEVKLTEPHLQHDQVLFAVRPCDVHALTALDALMLKEPADAYYAERRARTTLIGLACEQMGSSCFCTSLGLSPDDGAGMDVMLYRADGGYILEILTDKGRVALASQAPVDFEGSRPQRAWPEAAYQVPPRAVWTDHFNDPYWASLAERCLSCKICSYICPTCRCFDVRDYTVAQAAGYQKIERLRCWDSCMAEGYRRIAGGHNPRAAKAQRLRNRFYCKFDYYPADFGPLACVGCGRCVDQCPVNVDITEVLQDVAAR